MKLDEAKEVVNSEIHRLDHNADAAFEKVNAQFQAVLDQVENTRHVVLAEVKRKKDEKRKILDEQLNIIQSEKNKVNADVKATQNQVEVRNITKKISDLNCKLDTVSTLSEPRENSFIEYTLSSSPNQRTETNPDEFLAKVDGLLLSLGQVKTSKTFPSLCRATMNTAIANLEMIARVTTIDYNGSVQDHGGDPVSADIVDDEGKRVSSRIEDKEDGTYEIRFIPRKTGTYCLKVCYVPSSLCCFTYDFSQHQNIHAVSRS